MSDDANEIFDENLVEGDNSLMDEIDELRERVSNRFPLSARERTGKEREAKHTTRGTKSKKAEGEPNPEALHTAAKRHAEASQKANAVVDQVIGDMNEGLSQTAQQTQEELNNYSEHAEQSVDEALQWSHNPNRSTDETDNLLAYGRDKSNELRSVFNRLSGINGALNEKTQERETLQEEKTDLEERANEVKVEHEIEKKTRMTDSETDEAGINDQDRFAGSVADSTSGELLDRAEEKEERISSLNNNISKLKDKEDEAEDYRDELVNDVDEAYGPHFDELNNVAHGVTSQLHEDISLLESLAEMPMPNLDETQGVKHVSDAQAEHQRSVDKVAKDLAERVDTLYESIENVRGEAEELVEVLPENYLEDGLFDRAYDEEIERIEGMQEEVAGEYDTVLDRVNEAYEGATGQELYEAFEDAETTVSLLRASHKQE